MNKQDKQQIINLVSDISHIKQTKMDAYKKAKSITQEFYGVIATQHGEVPLEWDKAKLCTIFHADEMIKNDWFIPSKKDHDKWIAYWNEVKDEVEKL